MEFVTIWDRCSDTSRFALLELTMIGGWLTWLSASNRTRQVWMKKFSEKNVFYLHFQWLDARVKGSSIVVVAPHEEREEDDSHRHRHRHPHRRHPHSKLKRSMMMIHCQCHYHCHHYYCCCYCCCCCCYWQVRKEMWVALVYPVLDEVGWTMSWPQWWMYLNRNSHSRDWAMTTWMMVVVCVEWDTVRDANHFPLEESSDISSEHGQVSSRRAYMTASPQKVRWLSPVECSPMAKWLWVIVAHV